MLGWWLWLGLARGQAPALVGYAFGHFENVSDPERSAASIRRHLQLHQRQGVPIEAHLHRGEHQAAWLADNAPDVLQALRAPSVSLAYHPHGVRPFTDLVDALKGLAWDEAVAGFAQLERCAVDYTTAALDCSRPGGAAAVAQIVGRPISVATFSGVDAVATYVYHHLLGIPARDAGKSSMVTFSGGPVELYWYMGALVYHIPRGSSLGGYAQPDAIAALGRLPGPGPRLFSLLSTDKVERHDANDLIDTRYRPGVSTFETTRPRPSELAPARKVARYWSMQEDTLRAADRLVRRSGGHWATTPMLLAQLDSPAEKLTAQQLDQAAAALDLGLPSVEVRVGERHISLADLYDLLRTALCAWQAQQALPPLVRTDGILGPIGDPLRGEAPTGGPAARQPVPAAVLLAALAASPPDRVPWSLSVGADQDPLGPVEQLAMMAALYRGIHAGSAPTALARLPAAPWPVPGGVRGGSRTDHSRWDWYTRLQHWTTKRARWVKG